MPTAATSTFTYYLAPTACYAISWWLAGGRSLLADRGRPVARGRQGGVRPALNRALNRTLDPAVGPASGAASGGLAAADAAGMEAEAGSWRGPARGLLVLAVLFHAATLLLPWTPGAFHFGFGKLLSATALVGVIIWWFESRSVPLGRLELVLLPVAVAAMWLPWAFPGAAFRWDDGRPLFIPHLFVGTLAYAVMFVAAFHALLMAALERRLKPHRGESVGWFDWLITGGDVATPPLMVLERILFRLIEIGFLLLLATTLTGLVFSEETFGRPLRIEHKTVFSLFATAFFGLLLAGRRFRGWRGRKALKLAGWGFALLLLSYAGSRFVLEVIFHRI